MSTPLRIEAVGIPWFRREDWPTLREVFVDADKLHAKWDDWQRAAIDLEYRIKQSGKRVVRAEIRPEPFAAWCAKLGIPVDAAARTRWANEAAYREGRQQG